MLGYWPICLYLNAQCDTVCAWRDVRWGRGWFRKYTYTAYNTYNKLP